MMSRSSRNDAAVSPVVGVMLMLVVTIIIAAVVSAFSGGLSQTSSKAPQISIGAEAHNGDYILVDHKGGDAISGGTIIIKTFIPSGTFKDVSHQVNLKNVTYLPTNEALVDSYGGTRTIQPGDKIRIRWSDAFVPAYIAGTYSAPAVGEPLDIEVYDSSTGKAIATVRTPVLP